jgi:uncharacterized repeat protein (TIGR03803 family)
MLAQNRQAESIAMPRTLAVLCLLLIGAALLATVPSVGAQTFTVLHSFGNGNDGAAPLAGLTLDRGGNLYGTTVLGGRQGVGTIFKWSTGSSIYSVLYNFDEEHGMLPRAQMVFGPDGALYGTTQSGGIDGGFGVVFKAQPQSHPCPTVSCPWAVTVLHSFDGFDGFSPTNIAFDPAGNLYGVAQNTIYKLTHGNGSWSYSRVDYVSDPVGLAIDANGNVFGFEGGDPGSAFEIGSSGQLQYIYTFTNNTGTNPNTNPILDSAGNLYGQTLAGGVYLGGTVAELSPSGRGWSASVLNNFMSGSNNGQPGAPNLYMDAEGNIYGTVSQGGAYQYGEVFKLSPSSGGWTSTDLHDFCQAGYPNCSDGCYPFSNVVIDANGNLYGTTSSCGAFSSGEQSGGTLWKITP